MQLDIDLQLRLALFEHVEGLRREGGGVIHSKRLNEGMQFMGRRVPIWSQARGIYKPAVVGPNGPALSIQTSFRDPYEDGRDPNDDRLRYRYQRGDLNNSDNRAMKRAMELGRPILYLVAVKQSLYEAVFPCFVVGAIDEARTFLLIADERRHVNPAVDVDEDWPRKAYVTREVKQRLHQRRFRYLVLDAYKERCAMCSLRHTALLDAAHILPDRDVRGNPEVPNGLALCRIHHGAYDINILGVDPDYRIHVRADVLEEIDGPMLRHGLQEMQDRKLILPSSAKQRPRKDYLEERFARFQAA